MEWVDEMMMDGCFTSIAATCGGRMDVMDEYNLMNKWNDDG